jgi:protein TonB
VSDPAGGGMHDRDTIIRWCVAGLCAVGLVALLLRVCLVSQAHAPETHEPPPFQMEYIVLDAPKAPKPLHRVQPKPAALPPARSVPIEMPLAQAPVEPARTETASADLTSAPEQPPMPATTTAPAILTLSSAAELDNTEFLPLYNPKPRYPAIARTANIEGYVDAELIINENGGIAAFAFHAVSGHPDFGASLAEVLPRWRFPPPRKNGKKIQVKYIYRVNFKLD